MSDELGRVGLDYRADATGLFTDTANYMYLIPECTNLSVGYEREHGPTENLDAIHAGWLRGAMLKFDASGLPARRDPSAEVATLYAANDDLHRHYGSEVDEGLLECVLNDPERAAELLAQCGIDERDFDTQAPALLWENR